MKWNKIHSVYWEDADGAHHCFWNPAHDLNDTFKLQQAIADHGLIMITKYILQLLTFTKANYLTLGPADLFMFAHFDAKTRTQAAILAALKL